jgi:hypothetical protein
MTKVFLAGSRTISRLSAEVKHRIDTIVEKSLTVVLGDANGADKAFQKYLADKNHRDVVVFCMSGHCRNNVGGWPTREIDAPPNARGFEYYALKDGAMAIDASHGLMLWDGESKGTLNNVLNLVRHRKPVIVYLAPTREFETIRTPEDVTRLLGKCDPVVVRKIERQLDVRRSLDSGLIDIDSAGGQVDWPSAARERSTSEDGFVVPPQQNRIRS